jgi:NADH dehydrogenase
MRSAYYGTLAIGATVVVMGALTVGFFLYDMTTYTPEGKWKQEPVSVPELALFPQRGGAKNLPIAYEYLDSEEPDKKPLADKPRLVVLGSGWGSVSMLKHLDLDEYNVTVVSPSNYFLFTPLLPSATVGTVDLSALSEPLRRLCHIKAHFLEGTAEDVDIENRLVEISSYDRASKTNQSYYVPYDKLVIAVGCVSNTHGVEGLENCNFLKTVKDVRLLRTRIVNNFERACLPTVSEEERKQLLSFVICGGGPTGVEMAAELYDLISEDIGIHYPKMLQNVASVHIIQSRAHILNTYDRKISEYAQHRFRKDGIDVITNARVERVLPDRVLFYQESATGEKVIQELPYGTCVWSTGVAQAPFTRKLMSKLGPQYQRNKRALETDSHLRVIGTPRGEVYAIGDCSTVRTDLASDLDKLIRTSIIGNRRFSLTGPGRINDVDLAKIRITASELEELCKQIRKKHPQTEEHISRAKSLFEECDKDRDGTLSLDEISELLASVDKKILSLPATAQRAHQQGAYLGKKLTRISRAQGTVHLKDIDDGDVDAALYRAFHYKSLGALAYVSNAAVFDFNGQSFFGGLAAMYIWRSVYLAETVSLRSRVLMAIGWFKRTLFGRDMFSNEPVTIDIDPEQKT